MNDKDMNSEWKKKDSYYKKDYPEVIMDNEYDSRNRIKTNSISRSSSKESISRSRTYSKEKRMNHRRHRSRSRSRSHSNSHSYKSHNINNIKSSENKPALNFMIFLPKVIENSIVNNGILKRLEDQFVDIKLYFQTDFNLPDIDGCVLIIKSDDLRKKRDAAQSLLEYIVKADSENHEGKKGADKTTVLIMVPNGLISMIIGTKGRMISKLIGDSGANIIVNQPIYKMFHRTVTISGKPYNIANAIEMIQTIMEERYFEVSKVEMEFKPLNVSTTQTKVKLVLSEDSVECLSAKRESFINELREEYNVLMTFYQDRKNRQLERREWIACIQGYIDNVQFSLINIQNKIANYLRATYNGRDSYSLKMLINKVYVTKLIGAEGCMIQEIASLAGGASIKILSNRMDEKKPGSNDIVVCIAGGLGAIGDASCIIIEQMECFKKGGPVLKSALDLKENIAHQFINSIICSGGRKDANDEQTYTLRERFTRRKSHSRSRSRSNSKNRKVKKSRNDDNNLKTINNPHNSHKNDNLNLDAKDSSNNFSFEEKGIMKISIDILVPDYLVSLLIGKNGETTRSIMNKSGSLITFQKEYNDESKINTSQGVVGRVCTIKGTPEQNSLALQLISETIIKFETSLNGIRKEI